MILDSTFQNDLLQMDDWIIENVVGLLKKSGAEWGWN